MQQTQDAIAAAWAALREEIEALDISLPAEVYEIDPNTQMTRRGLSENLEKRGVIRIAPSTLARRACKGGGPPYRRWSASRSAYTWGPSVLWAARCLSPVVCSTSEIDAQRQKKMEVANG